MDNYNYPASAHMRNLREKEKQVISQFLIGS